MCHVLVEPTLVLEPWRIPAISILIPIRKFPNQEKPQHAKSTNSWRKRTPLMVSNFIWSHLLRTLRKDRLEY